jgi:glycerate kinase
MIVAVDVANPLLGPRGCTRIFGPQKGLAPEDFPRAERNLRRLAAVAKKLWGGDFAAEAGAGAAGGLGFGFSCFLGARLQPGFGLFALQAGLERRLRLADMVITGEGALDASTLMGKGVGQVAHRCAELKIPCLGLGGMVTAARGRANDFFTLRRGLNELTTVENAKSRPAFWLEQLARDVARDWRG